MSPNELSGKIPEATALLASCHGFDVNINQLSGRIPYAIGSMLKLQYLRINTNQLAGRLPNSMGSMTHLWLITISINRLSGTIPVAATCSPVLALFWAYDNRLSGSIPYCLMSPIKMAKTLVINDNQLTGSLPSLKAFDALTLVATKRMLTFPGTSIPETHPCKVWAFISEKLSHPQAFSHKTLFTPPSPQESAQLRGRVFLAFLNRCVLVSVASSIRALLGSLSCWSLLLTYWKGHCPILSIHVFERFIFQALLATVEVLFGDLTRATCVLPKRRRPPYVRLRDVRGHVAEGCLTTGRNQRFWSLRAQPPLSLCPGLQAFHSLDCKDESHVVWTCAFFGVFPNPEVVHGLPWYPEHLEDILQWPCSSGSTV